VAVGVGVAALGVVWALQRRSRERARRRTLAAALEAPKPEPEGLPVGAVAPDFTLTDVRGGTQSLESLRAHGRPVVLHFMDLSCAPCRELLPFVARWQIALAQRLTIAIVTSGSLDDRPEWDKYGVANVLLDNSGEVYGAYRVQGTPKAIGVWEDGLIAAAPAGGMHMPEVLIRILLRGPHPPEGRRLVGREAAETTAPALPVVVRFEPGSA
jgi:peroxiredoxin